MLNEKNEEKVQENDTDNDDDLLKWVEAIQKMQDEFHEK